VNDYEQSLELDPQNVKTLSNLGYSLAKMENYSEAILKYTRVLDLDPSNVHALHNRGISYDKQGSVSVSRT
jgi:lipoprotein NlpI